MVEKEMRNFALRDKDGNEIGVFTGRSPARRPSRQPTGAIRTSGCANGEPKEVHIFIGERVQVDKPKGAPEWMPDKIWKPMVKKVGMENLEMTGTI